MYGLKKAAFHVACQKAPAQRFLKLRLMVFVEPGSVWTYAGANGRGTPFSEQTAMTIADGAPCALVGGWRGRCSFNSSGRRGEAVERTAKLRYNFETGMWSNDRGEKFKNGVRVE